MSSHPSSHQLAIDHIVNATRHASKGNHDDADYHLKSAVTHAVMHQKKLEAQGRHDDAKEYMKGIQEHVNRIKGMKAQFQKAEESKKCEDNEKCSACKCNKSDCQCGYMDKNDKLKKGFLPPTGSPPPKQIMATPSKKMAVGQDPRYNYKPIHELHSDDQVLAQQKYGMKNMGSYHYPVNEKGRLVHGTRMKAPQGSKPRAIGNAYSQLKAEHSPGTAVRIQGHPDLTGKLGIVRGPHPAFPGKIAVQIGHQEHQKVFVDPNQVTLGHPQSRIEKAMVSLFNMRKAFFKNDSAKDS